MRGCYRRRHARDRKNKLISGKRLFDFNLIFRLEFLAKGAQASKREQTMVADGTFGRDNLTANEKLMRKVAAEQERVRERLKKLGGPLKPQRNGITKSQLFEPRSRLGTPVEIKVAATTTADWAARGLARALESCGFKTKTYKDGDSSWEGIHVESRSDEAATALVIQGAFRLAGLGAGLTIHDRAAANRVVVHVGPQGLS